MKMKLLLTLPLFLAAAPAEATGGFDCRGTDDSGVRVIGTVGRVVGNPLVAATLEAGGRSRSTADAEPQIAIARSWIDEREIRVDLADAQASRLVAELRARIRPRGSATGSLRRNGRSHPVRCEVE